MDLSQSQILTGLTTPSQLLEQEVHSRSTPDADGSSAFEAPQWIIQYGRLVANETTQQLQTRGACALNNPPPGLGFASASSTLVDREYEMEIDIDSSLKSCDHLVGSSLTTYSVKDTDQSSTTEDGIYDMINFSPKDPDTVVDHSAPLAIIPSPRACTPEYEELGGLQITHLDSPPTFPSIVYDSDHDEMDVVDTNQAVEPSISHLPIYNPELGSHHLMDPNIYHPNYASLCESYIFEFSDNESVVSNDESVISINEHEFKLAQERFVCTTFQEGITQTSKQTLLHWASRQGHAQAVRNLLQDNNVDVNFEYDPDWTALHTAIEANHLDVVRILVENGAAVNAESQSGETPLLLAAEWGYPDIIDYLLGNGAMVDIQERSGKTALHVAANRLHHEAVKTLVEMGANVKLPDAEGWTALHFAILNTHRRTVPQEKVIKLVTILTDYGVVIDQSNNSGNTALHYAALAGYETLVGQLLQLGADPGVRDTSGWTALHHAASWSEDQVIKVLLRHGALVTDIDNDSQTLLHVATRVGDSSTIKLLLDEGLTINAVDEWRQTPLFKAVAHGNLPAVTYLTLRGADRNQRDVFGRTPFLTAVFYGQWIVARFFLTHGSAVSEAVDGDSALRLAAINYRSEVVSLLLEWGADPRDATSSGLTIDASLPALHRLASAHQYHVEEEAVADAGRIIELLATAQPGILEDVYEGRSPLFIAASQGQRDLVGVMLRCGADAKFDMLLRLGDRLFDYYVSPLHCALASGDSECAHLLIKAGANFDITMSWVEPGAQFFASSMSCFPLGHVMADWEAVQSLSGVSMRQSRRLLAENMACQPLPRLLKVIEHKGDDVDTWFLTRVYRGYGSILSVVMVAPFLWLAATDLEIQGGDQVWDMKVDVGEGRASEVSVARRHDMVWAAAQLLTTSIFWRSE